MRTTSIITLAAAAAVLMMLSPAPEVQAAETMKPEPMPHVSRRQL